MSDDPEQLLQQLQRAREQLQRQEMFIAVVAHELRNPLGPILISLDALLMQFDQLDRDAVLHRVQATRRYVEAMRLQLDRLLDFSRFRSGNVELVLEDLDLSLVAGAVLDHMAPLLQAAHCEIRTDFTLPLQGHWDKMRLTQIIWNLVSNAVKYAAGAPIEVTTLAKGNLAVLTVEDHGPGIAPADREHVFTKFERASAGAHTGFGVGLWLVRRIVEAMQGSIELHSDVGKGSTFMVTLPRRAP